MPSSTCSRRDKPDLREKDAVDLGPVMRDYLPWDDERRWDPPLAAITDEDYKGAGAVAAELSTKLTAEYREIVESFISDPRARGLMARAFPMREDAGAEIARAFSIGLHGA